jgi:UDP-N-acetylglucosamine diphosphorylase/glucosamine-1-phosphate N-acetyltransferase
MEKNFSSVTAVILAAGLGTRMKSSKAKVLHELNGKPMITYVVETAEAVVGKNIVVVIGNQADKVRKVVSEKFDTEFAYQKEQLGTGHAVLCSLMYIPERTKNVVILCGDVPLLRPETVENLLRDHINMDRDVSILAVNINDPEGYGRLIVDSNFNVSGIVEQADATEEQRKIKTINSGIYCVKKDFLADALPQLKPYNAQKEYYFTDIIELGYKGKKNIGALVSCDHEEVIGINSLNDLTSASEILKKRPSKIT